MNTTEVSISDRGSFKENSQDYPMLSLLCLLQNWLGIFAFY